ncbi:MAG: A/G-specific adenine glycosylase [Cyanothece sp. SIO2G6]|nr:A/G-specific adenine glycosylase [Cyanothece sp. SIO2G6]
MAMADVVAMRRSLLSWYHHHGRDLPWRHNRDPYPIWISEIMLQQTQVKTVIPYYHRWLATFPSIAALANADEQAVLKVWQGLGYYARARNIHKAAQILMEQHHGVFPQEGNAVMALPGIGRTTAGGILSAAFDLPWPILDGNVKRILARLGGLTTPLKSHTKTLWGWSELLLDQSHPRDFNQAIMDLGATICVPRSPHCPHCPWTHHCLAYIHNLQAAIPMTEKNAPLPHKNIGVAVIRNARGQVLIDRRRPEGLLGGLWEFPGGKVEPGETIADCIVREIQEELGITIQVGAPLTTINHAYSHFRVTLHVHWCDYVAGKPQPLECDEVRWVEPQTLNDYPFPKANEEIIKKILGPQ